MKKIDLTGKQFNFLKAIRCHSIARENGRRRTYWECLCICGNITNVEQGVLVRGTTKSCSCRSKGLISDALKKGGYRANFVVTYHNIKNAGKERGYEWEITEESFHELSQKGCFYCDTLPNNVCSVRKTCEPFVYNGLDRVINTIGYTIDNVVPCCKDCNAGKGTDSQQTFFDRVKRINIKHNL